MKAHKLFGKDKKQDDQAGLDTLSEEVNIYSYFILPILLINFPMATIWIHYYYFYSWEGWEFYI